VRESLSTARRPASDRSRRRLGRCVLPTLPCMMHHFWSTPPAPPQYPLPIHPPPSFEPNPCSVVVPEVPGDTSAPREDVCAFLRPLYPVKTKMVLICKLPDRENHNPACLTNPRAAEPLRRKPPRRRHRRQRRYSPRAATASPCRRQHHQPPIIDSPPARPCRHLATAAAPPPPRRRTAAATPTWCGAAAARRR